MDKQEQQNNLTANILPIIPLRGKVAFPHTSISFEVGRDMTLKAVDKSSACDRLVFICTQKQTEKDAIASDDIYTVGCVAKIKQVAQLAGGAIRVLCEGLYRARARMIEFDTDGGYFYAVADEMKTIHGDETLEEAYFRTVKALVKDVLSTDGKISKETASKLEHCTFGEEYIDIAISAMRVRLEIKQSILEEKRLVERYEIFERCLNDELEISKLERKISASVRQSIDKSQKEYFLREQLKAIHKELGDDSKELDDNTSTSLRRFYILLGFCCCCCCWWWWW